MEGARLILYRYSSTRLVLAADGWMDRVLLTSQIPSSSHHYYYGFCIVQYAARACSGYPLATKNERATTYSLVLGTYIHKHKEMYMVCRLRPNLR